MANPNFMSLCAIALSVLLVSVQADDLTRVLIAVDDATIFGGTDEKQLAAGGGDLLVGIQDESPRRGLVKFDLTEMPEDAVVSSASFLFDVNPFYRSGEQEFQIFRLTADWSTTGVSGGLDPFLGTITGEKADVGDVTWQHRNYPTDEWTTIGGDFDETLLSAEQNEVGQNHEFPSTPELVDVIQKMISGDLPNYGFLIKGFELDSDDEAFRFFHGVEDDELLRKPRLYIKYTSVSDPVQAPTPPPREWGDGFPAYNADTACKDFNTGTMVDIPVSRDATIFQQRSSSAAGEGSLMVGMTKQGAKRALMYFDVESEIPDEGTVICAELSAGIVGEMDQGKPNVKLYLLTSAWTEGGSKMQEGGNNPEAAVDGDVTWKFRSFPGKEWKEAGSDYSQALIAFDKVETEETEIFFKDNALTRAVRAWADGDATNNGFLLTGPEVFGIFSNRMIASREHADENLRPRLTVRYMMPGDPPITPKETQTTLDTQSNSRGTENDGDDGRSGPHKGGIGGGVVAVIVAVGVVVGLVAMRRRGGKESDTGTASGSVV